MTDRILISVVIPVKNGVSTLDALLRGLQSQTIASCTEIIIIDSGSTDGTLDLARSYPVRIHEIPPEEFNHGGTRNLGVELSRGEFVVMTVQDAAPVDDQWLARMLHHFDDPEVAGVCGWQITPHDLDKNPLQWYRPSAELQVTRVQYPEPPEGRPTTGSELRYLNGWDDVTAMYRRGVLLRIPFRDTMFGEDFIWASDALSHGLALIHDDFACVNHYHSETFSYGFRRQLTTCYHHHEFFGLILAPSPFWRRIAQAAWHLARHHDLPWSRKFSWMLYNMQVISSQWAAFLASKATLLLLGGSWFARLHQTVCKSAPQALPGNKNS